MRKLSTPATLLLLFVVMGLYLPSTAAEHETGHYELEMDEGYYEFFTWDASTQEGVEVRITSSANIDVLLLTEAMYEQCCSSGSPTEYDYLEEGTELNTDEYRFVLENDADLRYFIIDHTSINEGGADPSGTVSIELYLTELPENLFEFHWQNLVLTLLLFPLCGLLVIETFKPGTASRVWKNQNVVDARKLIKESRLPMTYTFMAFNTVLFIARLLFSPGEDTILEYVEWGAMASGSVADGNFFALLSSNFFHFNFAHLGGNLFAIFILGRYLEPKFGSFRFLGILLTGGFISSLLSLFYDPYIPSGGASGMVFCAFGVILMEWILDRVHSTPYVLCQWHDMQWFWGAMALNAYTSFLPGVSLLGHLGGLLGGVGAVYWMTRLGTYPSARDDQLIHCRQCGFVFPVVNATELEIKKCPKCGLDFDGTPHEEE